MHNEMQAAFKIRKKYIFSFLGLSFEFLKFLNFIPLTYNSSVLHISFKHLVDKNSYSASILILCSEKSQHNSRSRFFLVNQLIFLRFFVNYSADD